MLTIKVCWGVDNHHGFPMYSVFTGKKYSVEVNPEGPNTPYTSLSIDDGVNNINLGPGSRTYVMNGSGATVDTIIQN